MRGSSEARRYTLARLVHPAPKRMPKGTDLLAVAGRHLGEKCVLGAPVPKDHPNWKGPWDCSEFVTWCVFQVSGRLYGCTQKDAGPPATARAYSGAWADDSRRLGMAISVLQAARTPGAAVLRYPQIAANGHVVLSDGNGGTIEAMGGAFGVRRGFLDGRRWDVGILVPWIHYAQSSSVAAPTRPQILFKLGDAGDDVRELQLQLIGAGLSPGDIDGMFGPHTQAAVVAFQLEYGLVADGEAGPKTLESLAFAQPKPRKKEST